MTQRYKMVLAYDGRAYAGWQVQPGQRTVQGECEAALQTISRQQSRIECSGRTDAGVHARAQVTHFDLEAGIDPDKLRFGLNGILDEDIRIISIAPVSSDFHARFSARRKEYRYFIWNDSYVPPDLRFYRLHCPCVLDIDKMRAAAALLLGRHDFASFCSYRGKGEENTERNLLGLDVDLDGAEIVVRALSEGFLYKMVRSLAGYLIRVGLGNIPVEDTGRILAERCRTARVPSAEPHGLFLWRIDYPAEFQQ
jgi:tRNA pseudouridine38-40 synthase